MKKSVYLSGLLALCCSFFAITAKAQAPVVTTDPVHDTTCAADTAWFHITATGTAVTYMWQYSTDAGGSWDTTTDGSVYSGTYNDTLRVIPTAAMNGTWYRCVAINTSGMDTSGNAALRVDTVLTLAAISGGMPFCKASTIALTHPVTGGTWSTLHPLVSTVSGSGVVTGVNFGWDTVVYSVMNTCGTFTVSTAVRVDTNMVPYPIMGPDAVCVGNAITLTNTNVIGSHTWSAGMTGHTSVSALGVVTGAAPGLDTITYSITNSCNTVVSDMEVMVESLLSAGTISGASVICAGSWTHLTATASMGMWISGSTGVAVVSSTGNVTGIGIGTSVISYYQSNSCGASVATHTMTVNIPAAPISGNDSVGIDSTLMLSDIVPGGAWSSANPTIATVGTSGLVTGVDTGVATIWYTVTNACGTTSASMTMNVGPLPDPGTVAGADTVCIGATITLNPTVAGGTWVSRWDTLATVSGTGVVTGVNQGKDTVFYYVTTAFGRSKVAKAVYVNQPPVITLLGPGSVALGGYYTLTVTPTAATGGTFTSSNPTMAPLVGYGFFVVLDTGHTTFTYTKTNGCGTRSKTFSISFGVASQVSSVGVGLANLQIFPNPTYGALTVNLTSGVKENVVMTLTNLTGQKVQEFTVPSNTATEIAIDQPAGVYLLNAVTQDGNRHSARITVTR